jgi:hypothetical protein
MKKLRFLLACLSVFMIAATSCSKSNGEKEEKGGGDIVGTWEYHGPVLAADKCVGFIEFDKNGDCYSLLEEVWDGYQTYGFYDGTYGFYDGVYNETFGIYVAPYYKASYTVKGNSLTINCTELFDTDDVPKGYVPKKKSITFTYSVQGNSLIVSGGDYGFFPSFLFKFCTLTKSSITISDYNKNKEAYLKKIF